MKSDKYDIIIIGAGIGGLVSAALLSNLGKKILIIEKEPKAGGYLTEFKSGDFTFDVSLHMLNGCNPGGYVSEIFERCGIKDDIKFLKPKYLYRSIFPDFDVRMPQGIDKQRELLISLFPECKEGIDGLINDSSKIFRILTNKSPSAPTPSILLLYLRNSYEKILSGYISDVKLKALLSQMWICLMLPPSAIRAVDFCYPYFDYAANGGYYPQKGSYAMTKALVDSARKRGARLLLSRTVDRIVVDDGVCKGVKCGDEVFFCDAVISNMDLHRTVSNLIGKKEFSPNAIRKIDAVGPSISAVEIFLGLSVDLQKIYPDDYEIFVNPDYDIDNQYKDSLMNRADRAPFAIGIHSNLNRFAAPEGKTAMTVIMLAGYDYWAAKSREEYERDKEKVADILIKRTAKIMPELKKHIEKRIVATPLTFERYTGNSRGAICGYAQTIGDDVETRPNEIKDIKNLYFASAWARRGSGVLKVLRAVEDVCGRISKLV